MPKRDRIERFLPMKPAAFHILLALADGPRHGYAIRTSVEHLTQGGIRLWPATLYGSVRQLGNAGLIEPMAGGDGADDDARRRYYRLTALGRRVLAAETERLRALVEYARGTRAIAEV
ncbi:MAG: PadR family transcriptional regulator [Longimicrobiales bacterium]